MYSFVCLEETKLILDFWAFIIFHQIFNYARWNMGVSYWEGAGGLKSLPNNFRGGLATPGVNTCAHPPRQCPFPFTCTHNASTHRDQQGAGEAWLACASSSPPEGGFLRKPPAPLCGCLWAPAEESGEPERLGWLVLAAPLLSHWPSPPPHLKSMPLLWNKWTHMSLHC